LKFAKVLGKENVRQGFFGQEINLTIYNLCRINMFLHDINYNHFDIAHGDTLTDPKHWDDEPFDAIVSNPPYSIRWEGDSNPLLINDPRFSPAGVLAPKSKADLAFTMHMLSWLSTIGTAAIVEFPGVLYRGGAEQKIRKYLVDNNYIDTVIQLPPDLFFGTTIATCIIVLKKSKKDNKTLFIDASAEFVRGGNKNKLSDENRARILKAFTERADIEHFARLVDNKTIEENDYNIAVSSYVAQKDTREVIDITKLNAEIADIVARQNELRTAIDEIVADTKFAQTTQHGAIQGKTQTKTVEFYNLDIILAVGYRANSSKAIEFRKWATKTLKQHLLQGYTINKKRIGENYDKFMQAVADVKALLPAGSTITTDDVLVLINAFAGTWFSLDAYDKNRLPQKGASRKQAVFTAAELIEALKELKKDLVKKKEATELFGKERSKDSVKGIVGNVFQSVLGKDAYPGAEEKGRAPVVLSWSKTIPLWTAINEAGRSHLSGFCAKQGSCAPVSRLRH
jgi:hypothetical protein